MRAVDPSDWSRPTRCPPWSVADLLGHVTTAVGRLPDMLAAPAPTHAEVSAAGYFRPDERFSAQTNADRIDVARQRAADPSALPQEFDRTWRQAARLCRAEPPDRVVRTRHGDAMLLADFLVTRIVEVAVHGLDLADALDRPAWLTSAAVPVLIDLLLAGRDHPSIDDLGWTPADFLRKLTGRRTLTPDESRYLDDHAVPRLALGPPAPA